MRKIIYLILIVALVGCMTSCQKSNAEQVQLEPVDVETTEEKEEGDTIFVYVCGAVVNEGVYEVPGGSRVYEVIEMAGGFRPDAATTAVNQAETLEDETHLYIPTISEMQDGQAEDDGKININSATKAELMTLPGVGEARAESIIQYREEHGPFQNVEDIMSVSGIKEGLFAKIKDFIKI